MHLLDEDAVGNPSFHSSSFLNPLLTRVHLSPPLLTDHAASLRTYTGVFARSCEEDEQSSRCKVASASPQIPTSDRRTHGESRPTLNQRER